jgi:AraC family transcriptional regulator of adaptative response / methylphosphotriester-DNA alkyltransferase methyltransferase
VHPETLAEHRRLYLLARVVVARHYRRELTLTEVAAALSSSPRQLQRAYARFGEHTFKEDLFERRMAAAAELLIEQPAIPVHHVARLVGYRQGAQFARAFRRCYGISPACFREQGRRHKRISQGATAERAVARSAGVASSRAGVSVAGVSAHPRATHTGE